MTRAGEKAISVVGDECGTSRRRWPHFTQDCVWPSRTSHMYYILCHDSAFIDHRKSIAGIFYKKKKKKRLHNKLKH